MFFSKKSSSDIVYQWINGEGEYLSAYFAPEDGRYEMKAKNVRNAIEK